MKYIIDFKDPFLSNYSGEYDEIYELGSARKSVLPNTRKTREKNLRLSKSRRTNNVTPIFTR